MFVKCRPFYLPQEFTAIVIAAVYIPPCANAKDALRELYSAISEQQTNNPDGFSIIAGDFFSFFFLHFYAFSRRFYPKRLTLHSSYSFLHLISSCFPWESNP